MTDWAELHVRMRAFVARRVGDPDDADDIAQDVLLRLQRHLGSLRDEDRLDAFAYRIARNAIADHHRARGPGRETPVDRVEERAAPEGLADDHARRELARCLAPLVDALPPAYRDALAMTDLGELSQVDAAARAGIGVPGMKARVQRARVKLRAELERCCTVALDDSSRIAGVTRVGPCGCGPGDEIAGACC